MRIKTKGQEGFIFINFQDTESLFNLYFLENEPYVQWSEESWFNGDEGSRKFARTQKLVYEGGNDQFYGEGKWIPLQEGQTGINFKFVAIFYTIIVCVCVGEILEL